MARSGPPTTGASGLVKIVATPEVPRPAAGVASNRTATVHPAGGMHHDVQPTGRRRPARPGHSRQFRGLQDRGSAERVAERAIGAATVLDTALRGSESAAYWLCPPAD